MEKLKTEYIQLQQFLKLCGAASTGGEAKIMCQEGDILVNNQKETRRGRKLYPGDTVKVNGRTYTVE